MDGHQVSLALSRGATGDRPPGAGRQLPINTARLPRDSTEIDEYARNIPTVPERFRTYPNEGRTWQMSLWDGSAAFRPPWKLWKFTKKVHPILRCGWQRVQRYTVVVYKSAKLVVTLCVVWVFWQLHSELHSDLYFALNAAVLRPCKLHLCF